MKISQFEAHEVHGYLTLNVDFYPDLTFITGLNGSGKTTVLRLLVALLTPTPEEIISISFSRASVTVMEGDRELLITAIKTSDGLELLINTVPTPLVLTSSDLQLLIDARRRETSYRDRDEGPVSPIYGKITSNPTYNAIRSISTPMFLGLDRRFTGPAGPYADSSTESSRRALIMRRTVQDDPSFRGVGIAAALADVNYLVFERMQEVRAKQEKLDEELRRKVFTRAFEYKPADLTFSNVPAAPTRKELETYRGHLADVERAADSLRLPVPELRTALASFFDRMSSVTADLERATPAKEGMGKKPPVASNKIVEWFINKPQTDRILEHVGLLTDYLDDRKVLREPIERFLSLVNGFLEQTNKRVAVASNGELEVHLARGGGPRRINALSSGERQLVVMLGHLSLNQSLEHSGVFIVDEPELSLHIAWQERFVEAVTRANPKVQLILATHSPAIILDRTDACRSLS